jgi:hypothetical protein
MKKFLHLPNRFCDITGRRIASATLALACGIACAQTLKPAAPAMDAATRALIENNQRLIVQAQEGGNTSINKMLVLPDSGTNSAAKSSAASARIQSSTPMGSGNPDAKILDVATTVIFISSGMPDKELLPLLEQGAGKKGVLFVMRGWSGDGKGLGQLKLSLIKRMQRDVKQPGILPSIVILPQAFTKYKVTAVPAVLHKNKDGKWYKVDGALSIDGTIAHIERRTGQLVLGPQWPITEPDKLLEFKDKNSKFDWDAYAKKGTEKAITMLQNGFQLPQASSASFKIQDPTLSLSFDVKNSKGQVVLPKGTKINPLARDPMGKRGVLVVDGSQEWQVKLARKIITQKPYISLNFTHLGSLPSLKVPVFPLMEVVASRFGFAAVPSLSEQSGLKLNVSTFVKGNEL